MEYNYGYLPSVGGGVWVVYPVDSNPEVSHVFASVSANEAQEKAAELNADRLCENCGEWMSQHVGPYKFCKNGEWNNWGMKTA